MNPAPYQRLAGRKIYGALFLFVLCAILGAALWPFNPYPANGVSWLRDENGVRFSGHGIILGSGRLDLPPSPEASGASLEIWVEPEEDVRSTELLAFSSRENPWQFRLRQAFDFLLVVRGTMDRQHHVKISRLWVKNVFKAKTRNFIVISSGDQGTSVYTNGVRAAISSSFRFRSGDLSDQLILGSSPVAYDTWRGKVLGLATFASELTPAQISAHYEAWLTGLPDAIKNDQPISLYKFDERAGSTVRNEVASQPNLQIPKSFNLPFKPFLSPPWKEFFPTQAYLLDISLNIIGFVPLGFLFCAYFSPAPATRKSIMVAILFGAAVSLSIEILQFFLPMRNSGITDIITNTLGTAFGAMLHRAGALAIFLRKFGLRTCSEAGPEQP